MEGPSGAEGKRQGYRLPLPPTRVLGSERGFPAAGGPSPVWEAQRERTPPESRPPPHFRLFPVGNPKVR